ncbi:hypothetical protein DPMN_107168 [Dreissena polymorpha]|uniref:Uncharacterized protein n=1 Tax=Dreissena polymorpha TaxID=45954 RepID=A0A9D4QKS3_DREPO|nr:hypothetical protein DPMN_107168 [Dreissena polymorpha]
MVRRCVWSVYTERDSEGPPMCLVHVYRKRQRGSADVFGPCIQKETVKDRRCVLPVYTEKDSEEARYRVVILAQSHQHSTGMLNREELVNCENQ